MKCFQEMCNNISSANPCWIIHLGYFNAQNIHWFQGDITDTPSDPLERVFDDTGLQQLVSEPTHLWEYYHMY